MCRQLKSSTLAATNNELLAAYIDRIRENVCVPVYVFTDEQAGYQPTRKEIHNIDDVM